MVRYRFAQGDLLRTRFAIAPLMELVGALYVLRDPARYQVHRPWSEWAQPPSTSRSAPAGCPP